MYRVEFSIYGHDVIPAWKRQIITSITVAADSREEAIKAAMKRVSTLSPEDITAVSCEK